MKGPDRTRKILQALYYIQSRSPNSQNRYNRVYLLKMIYLADRYHIRHFGFAATEDTYYAMKLGPVASATFDILKKNVTENCRSEVDDVSENEVVIKEQGEDELSESFKEALDFALREFGNYGWQDLSEISHCYPEWKKHGGSLSVLNRRVPMNTRDFFDDPEDEGCFARFGKNTYAFKEDKEFLELMKEDFDENTITS